MNTGGNKDAIERDGGVTQMYKYPQNLPRMGTDISGSTAHGRTALPFTGGLLDVVPITYDSLRALSK
jgi:hypothetical protein